MLEKEIFPKEFKLEKFELDYKSVTLIMGSAIIHKVLQYIVNSSKDINDVYETPDKISSIKMDHKYIQISTSKGFKYKLIGSDRITDNSIKIFVEAGNGYLEEG